MTESDHLRLFVAAPVPDPWHPWLHDAQRKLDHALPGYFRMTRPETWHLTVLFLGSQAIRAVPTIRQAVQLAAAATMRFELSAGDLGAPGKLDRPRLVWLGCDDHGVLERAQRRLLIDLRDIQLESAPFRAHVTLGRARKPERVPFKDTASDLNRLQRPEPVSIDRLVLYRSHLGPSGARYEPLLECPLQ